MEVSITTDRVKSKLKHPYNLAIGAVYEFDSIITIIKNEDRMVWGEATPLHGYSWETADSIWETVNRCRDEAGGDPEKLKQAAEESSSRAPFAAASMISAVEKFRNIPFYWQFEDVEIPLAGIVNGETEEEIEKEVKALATDGYGTLKAKLLGDVIGDIDRIKKIQELTGRDTKLRLDANQSYDIGRVERLFKEIDVGRLELLEQPFERNAWKAVKALSGWSPVPIMLDESIWNADDIEKAAEAGAGFVKLKLMKHTSISNTIDLAKKARELGLKVILGNGVQTDLGCADECFIYKAAGLEYAGEMNGFLKLDNTLLSSDIYLKNGKALLNLNKVLTGTKNIKRIKS